MSIKFPLNDIRKDIQNNWELELVEQTITVPMSGDYIVRLWEIPDNGEIESVPSITGLTLVNTYTPDPLQFAVKYSTGDVIFNQNESGNTYTISYYGKGSLVEADDINYLYSLSTSANTLATSAYDLAQSNKYSISTKTNDYTLTNDDYTILLDGTSNTVTATLLTAIGNKGRIYNIKCIDDTFTCNVECYGAETIDGETTIDLIKYETITVQSDGINWLII